VYLNRHRFLKTKSSRDFKFKEEQAMRVLILALSVLGIFVIADAAKASPSTTIRDLSASVDPATLTDEATQETEDQIGLDKGKRRDVQRQLTGLGFDTKVNGKFDESTRAVITRWQGARGYPQTGFLNPLQHKALLTEFVSAAHASSSSSDKSDDDHLARRRGGGGAHRHRGGGGPGGLIGGMMGGLFGRR
jgi:Putative peptidoglycan binding domain